MNSPAPLRAEDTSVLFLRTDACTVEPRIRKESRSLARAGYHVQAFGWDRKSEYKRLEEIDGVVFRRSRIPGPYGSKFLAIVLPLFWLRAALHLLRVRPRIVHACDLDALIPVLALRPVLRYSVVYDIFDHFAHKIGGVPAALRKIIHRFDLKVMARADAVIVADDHRRALVAGARIRRVEIVMNVPELRPAAPPGATGTSIRVCHAGAIHEHRGLYVMAEALRGLERTEVVFAGWTARERDRKFLQSQDWIRYLGKIPHEDALQLLEDSEVSLALFDPQHPINAMASSNKVFEAMAAGRPIITNEETTMSAMVREEKCGVLVPYGDRRALRDAVQTLRDRPQLRTELGNNGRRAFESRYRWEIMADRLAALYADLRNSSARLRGEERKT